MPGTERPTSFDPAKAATIIKHVKAGCYLKVAAAAAGVSVSRVQYWLRRGKRSGKKNEPYRIFRNGYMVARAESRIVLEKQVHTAARDNANMALKVLERLYPEDWSQHKDQIRRLVKQVAEIKSKLKGGDDDA